MARTHFAPRSRRSCGRHDYRRRRLPRVPRRRRQQAGGGSPARLITPRDPRAHQETRNVEGILTMDRLLFGDNQFFGVNHMSEEKARAQSMRFQHLEAIIDVLDDAYEEGIRSFMCTTHDRVARICDHLRANQAQYPDFAFMPCMPYAHKYANAVTEFGMLRHSEKFVPNEGCEVDAQCVEASPSPARTSRGLAACWSMPR